MTTSHRDKEGDMDCQYWWRKRTGELEPRPHADHHGYGLRASLGNRQTMCRGRCGIIRGFSRINRGTKIWTDKQKQKAKSVLWKVRSVCWESGLSSGNCSKPRAVWTEAVPAQVYITETVDDPWRGFKCMCVSQQSSDDPTEHDGFMWTGMFSSSWTGTDSVFRFSWPLLWYSRVLIMQTLIRDEPQKSPKYWGQQTTLSIHN